jgi:hypothetical protein
MSGEFVSVSNGKRLVSNVKKRAKMFAVCAWMQIAAKGLASCEVDPCLVSRFSQTYFLI